MTKAAVSAGAKGILNGTHTNPHTSGMIHVATTALLLL